MVFFIEIQIEIAIEIVLYLLVAAGIGKRMVDDGRGVPAIRKISIRSYTDKDLCVPFSSFALKSLAHATSGLGIQNFLAPSRRMTGHLRFIFP